MNKYILVVNAGSSSIKFKLFQENNLTPVASGLCERIKVDGAFEMKWGSEKFTDNPKFDNHEMAAKYLINTLIEKKIVNNLKEIVSIGNRVVQGGDIFKESTLLTQKDIETINELSTLAPLHNPGAVITIKAFQKVLDCPHVAVFDTSFHNSMPEINYMYGTPYSWFKNNKVRRYGAHGTSVKYITQKFGEVINKKNPTYVCAHLGNGSSITAVKNGKSFNTSMGLTPLEGLIMGTRCGPIDPNLIGYISKELNKDPLDIINILNKESGLKGISELSSDMRDLIEASKQGNKQAKLAFNLFCKTVSNYLAMYMNDLEGAKKIDGIVFTAGIGENSMPVREQIINFTKVLDLKLDKKLNETKFGDWLKISSKTSAVPIYIIRTDEELMIAQDTKRLVK